MIFFLLSNSNSELIPLLVCLLTMLGGISFQKQVICTILYQGRRKMLNIAGARSEARRQGRDDEEGALG